MNQSREKSLKESRRKEGGFFNKIAEKKNNPKAILEEIAVEIFEENPRITNGGMPTRLPKAIPGEIAKEISEECRKKTLKKS